MPAAPAPRPLALPPLQFPDELPIAQHRDRISELIRAHPVTIVCGETGSGKTTQLPKICLELGRGVRGLIGHTQPRRIGTEALAQRLEKGNARAGRQLRVAMQNLAGTRDAGRLAAAGQQVFAQLHQAFRAGGRLAAPVTVARQ